jgi:bis(5'-nucleosyl)-tetraphosphatase (symmetrical)
MATYAVGDIHGCFETFQALLSRLRFSPEQDRLWLVGDLVNRGPDSQAVLQWVRRHERRTTVVLGNHDLHLIFGRNELRRSRSRDALSTLWEAPAASSLVNWLSRRRLMVRRGPWVLVHAGILPAWPVRRWLRVASRLEKRLRTGRWRGLDKTAPDGDAGFRLTRASTLRVLTNLRCCRSEREPLQGFTGPPESAPPGTRPWFAYPAVSGSGLTFLFGHWASLGFYRSPSAWCLDSGCVYGGELTAVRLEDGRVFQERNRESVRYSVDSD